ncbi:MAG: WG repeat-containing protein, partial [Flavobacteriales bacterium]
MRKYEKWGFINDKGEWAIEPKFDQVRYFSEGLAPASKGKKWGFIDKSGNWKLKPEYSIGRAGYTKTLTGKKYYNKQAVDPFSEGLAPALGDEGIIYINKNGEKEFDKSFDAAYPFKNGLARVKKDGKVGYINKKGEFVIDPKWEKAGDFANGYA